MARDIQLRLTGRAEKLFDEMEKEGVTERDLLGYALGLLDAVKSGRLAMLRVEADEETVQDAVDYVFALPGQRIEQRKSRAPATLKITDVELPHATGEEVITLLDRLREGLRRGVEAKRDPERAREDG